MARKERETKAANAIAEAERATKARLERAAREKEMTLQREARARQRAAEEVERRQKAEEDRAEREMMRQLAEEEAQKKAAAAAAEWQKAHKRLKEREQQHKKDSEAAVRLQAVFRGILTRRKVADQMETEGQLAAAQAETLALMQEAAAEAEKREQRSKEKRRARYEEKLAAEQDAQAEEERRLARKAAAKARAQAAKAAKEAEVTAIRRQEAAVAREARARREQAMLLSKRAEIESGQWRSSSSPADSRPASALPPVAVGAGWRGDTPLGTDHHHERRELQELRQVQDKAQKRGRSAGPRSAATRRQGRSRPLSAPVLSLTEWEFKMEAAHASHADQRAQRSELARERLLETSQTDLNRGGSARSADNRGVPRTNSGEEREQEMRDSSEAMEQYLQGAPETWASQDGSASEEDGECLDPEGEDWMYRHDHQQARRAQARGGESAREGAAPAVFDAAIDRVATMLSGKLRELSPDDPVYEDRRLRDCTNQRRANRVPAGGQKRQSTKLTTLPQEVARGASDGEMGEEEVHRLLEDLVSPPFACEPDKSDTSNPTRCFGAGVSRGQLCFATRIDGALVIRGATPPWRGQCQYSFRAWPY